VNVLVRWLAVAAAAVGLAACQSAPSIRPDAFDNGQRAAILSLQAQPKISVWAAPGTVGPELDAAPVLAELRPVIVEALAKSSHFVLVPEAKVLAAPAYVALQVAPDPSGLLSAPGYKAVTGEALYPKLARDVGADMGVGLVVSLVYRAEDGAAGIVVSVGALDTRGRGVWKGGAAVLSERSVDVRTASTKARNEAFRDVARKAMAQLEESMSSALAFELARKRSRY
jgi:hypothetical protein